MLIIVQKFGGTSVATDESRARVVARVKAALEEGYSVVVVVSAMGRAGDPYATDTLIALAKRILPNPDPRDLDLLMSCGEIISSVIVGSTLSAAGIKTAVLTAAQAGIVTDENYGNAEVIKVDPHRILEHLELGYVVVVPGFQGVTQSYDITTLGRGGSDTTAAVMGAALKAECVEICTDVDGIKTADPRIVPDAKTIETMTFEEVCQMAHEGAKVIHPRAVEIAMQHSIPVRVRSTFNDSPGTLITSRQKPDSPATYRVQKLVTGVTHMTDLCRYTICVDGDTLSHIKVFRKLADEGISIDMIAVTPSSYSFVIREEHAKRAEEALKQTGIQQQPDVLSNCAKVSIVGSGMRGMPGVMANVAEALHEAGVKLLQTADSNVTISCLIHKADLEKAVRALHRRFNLSSGPAGLG